MPDKKKKPHPRTKRGQHYKRSSFLADELERLRIERPQVPLGAIAEVGAGFLPGVGEAMDLYDIGQAVKERDPLGAGFGLLSLLLPGSTRAMKKLRGAKKIPPGMRGDPRIDSGGGYDAEIKVGPFSVRTSKDGWNQLGRVSEVLPPEEMLARNRPGGISRTQEFLLGSNVPEAEMIENALRRKRGRVKPR